MVGIVMLFILCLIFVAIGIYISKQTKPVLFREEGVAGSIKISDEKKFNRAHGSLYVLYSIPFAVTAMFLLMEQELVATILLTTNFTVGLILLAKGYQRLTETHKVDAIEGLQKASIG